MSNPILTKTYVAEAAILVNRIVRAGTTDDFASTATGPTDFLIGCIEGVSPLLGERVEVITHGIADVTLGATVARGAPVTSDATGRAVTAAPAAGVNNRIIGFARQSGVVGDIVEIIIAPGVLQG